jgi:hypothetical protein
MASSAINGGFNGERTWGRGGDGGFRLGMAWSGAGAVGRAVGRARGAGRVRQARLGCGRLAAAGGGGGRGEARVGPTCHREKEGRGWAAGRLGP